MSTTYSETGLAKTSASTPCAFGLFGRYWAAFGEWRQRQKLRATLHGLSDRELFDIGTTRGEIDYVASNRSIDPRDVRSIPAINAKLSEPLDHQN
jgi:uncharacterized protein YjiS (DUF1127 family)